jgi:hypothetical protein
VCVRKTTGYGNIMKQLVVLGLVLFSVVAVGQNTFRARANGQWANAATWLCVSGPCTETIPNGGDDIVYTEGYQIALQGSLISPSVRDLYVAVNLRAGNTASIRRQSGAPGITVTGQLRGYNYLTQADASPNTNVLGGTGTDGNISFLFTGTGLLQPTNPVITSWGPASPFYIITFQSPIGTVLNVTTFGVRTTMTVGAGGVNVLTGNTVSGGVGAGITVALGAQLRVEGAVNGGVQTTSFSTVTINGSLTLEATGYLNATTFSLGASGIINHYFTGIDQTEGWWFQSVRPTTLTMSATSVLNMMGNSPQNIFARTTPNAYGSIFISNASDVTITTPVVSSMDITGFLTNAGTLNVNGAEVYVQNVVVNSGTMMADNTALYALSDLHNTGILDATSSFIEVSGKLLNDGSFVATDAYTLLYGDLENNASFEASGSTVEFANGVSQVITGTSPITFNDMYISLASAVSVESNQNLYGIVTLDANCSLDGDGSTNNAIFTLLSTADDPTQDAAIATLPPGAAITGKVRVQRYMNPTEGPILNGEVYRLISSAVQDATVADIQNEIPVSGYFPGASDPEGCNGGCGPAMWTYNESLTGIQDDGFEAFPVASNAETLVPGKGYFLYQWGYTLASVPSTWDVNGIPNQGQIDLNISFTADSGPEHDGWNLIGNPYPSTIDWDAPTGWTRAGMSDFIYMIDYVTNSYTTYMLNGPGTNGGTQYIPTGQGFWVQGIDGTASLTINENAKAAGQSTTFFRTKGEAKRQMLRIALDHKGRKDETIVLFREDASHDFDARLDALKKLNKAVNLSTLNDDRKLVINSLSKDRICGTTVSLAVTEVMTGTHTLSFMELDSFDETIHIELKDAYTGTTVNVREHSTYSLTLTDNVASYGTSRFSVQFSVAPVTIITGEDGTLRSPYATGNQWYLNGSRIEGATGQVFEPTETGLYTLRVGSGSCISEDELVFAVTSVEESEASKYSVYPNPVGNERLTVRIPLSDTSEAAVLYNSSGSVVGKVDIRVKEDHREGVFDMSSFSSGLYLLRFTGTTGMRVIKISKH